MGFLDKFLNKFTSRASDKLADKAVNKIFGKEKNNNDTIGTNVQQEQPVAPIQQEQPQNNPALDTAQMAMMTAMAKEQTKQMKIAQESMAQMNNLQSGAGFAGMGNMNMAQSTEVLNYMIFNDDMEVIGVKDDAPDWLKIAYKNGKLNNKD